MKPLNHKERQKAMFKVIGLFILSFAIAVILGFSTMNVSKISDHNAKTELETLKNNLKFQREVFAPNVAKTKELLMKLPNGSEQGENIEVLNQDIGALLSSTKNQIIESESWEPVMYKDVIQVLSALQLAYNDKIKLQEELGGSDKANEELEQCKLERLQLQNQLSLLQAGNPAGGGGGGGGNTEKLEKELKDAQQKLRACNLENRVLKQEIDKIKKN